MEELKNSIVEALRNLGFDNILEFKEKQKRDFRSGLFVLWFFLNAFLGLFLPIVFIWVFPVIFALLLEQLLSFYLLWRKNISPTSSLYSQSLTRTFTQRINDKSTGIYLITRILVLLTLNPRSISPIIILVIMFFEGMISFNTVLFKHSWLEAIEFSYLSIKDTFTRGKNQIKATINSSIRNAIPSIVLIFLIGFISQEVWELIYKLEWNRFLLVFLLIFLFIVIPGVKQLGRNIQQEIGNIKIDPETINYEYLIQALFRVNYKHSKQILLHASAQNDIFESNRWKWQADIRYRVLNTISYELTRRATWRFWAVILFFLPIFFGVILGVSIILFPRELLEQWVGRQDHLHLIFAWSIGQTIEQWAENIFFNIPYLYADPLLKFSAFTSLLLMGQLILRLTSRDEKTFSILQENDSEVKDWAIIILAYYCIVEKEFQLISSHLEFGQEIDPRYRFISIVLVPDAATQALLRRVVPRYLDLFISKDFGTILIVRTSEFLKSDLAMLSSLELKGQIPIIQNKNLNSEFNAWVWVSKFYGGPALKEFISFNEAKDYLLPIVTPAGYPSPSK